MIQGTALIFYLIFIRKFLDTKRNHPFLEKMILTAEVVIIAGILSYSILYFSTSKFVLLNYIEDITKQFLLVTGLVFIVYGLIRRSPLMNYLVAGQIILTLFSGISLLLIITRFRVVDSKHSIFNDSLLYYELGLIFELIFFLAGLAYKHRKEIIERVKERERLKLDNERKELEKQVAVLEAKQDERNRISVDMHDELGSGVTAIRLMSEIVKSKMKEQTLPEIEKISQSANELLIKMNAIIWTMTSSNDTLENLVAYIRAYAVEFFENTSVDCYFDMPSVIPAREINGEKRRNIFLCVKEALNNALKHSQASVVKINIIINDKLIICIQDDGVGINLEKIRKFGNGLNNMRKRMVSIEGECHIENDGGTKTTFQLAL
jgi:signal transduction histidine kinase